MEVAQVKRLSFTHSENASKEERIVVSVVVLTSSADPFTNAPAAVLVPVRVHRAVHIEINPYRGQSAWTAWTVASRAVAATDVGVPSDEERQDEA